MIVFRHGVSDFKNLLIDCEGFAPDQVSTGTATLMNALMSSLRKRNPPKLSIKAAVGCVYIRCEYNQYTAEQAMMAICGFEWMAEHYPDHVTVERLSSEKVKQCMTSETRKPKSC